MNNHDDFPMAEMMEHSPLSPHNTEAWMTPPPTPSPNLQTATSLTSPSSNNEKEQFAPLYGDDKEKHIGRVQNLRDTRRRGGLPGTVFWFALGILAVFWSLKLAAFGDGDGFSRFEDMIYPEGDGGSVGSNEASKTNHSIVTWDDIAPSERLEWQRCPVTIDSTHYCARLTVPMDYHRPLTASNDNPKVHIAMVLVRGSKDRDLHDPASFAESPMLINPGGPGGSGVSFAAGKFGTVIQGIAGDKYDAIGFDPRGVGATTPRADCFRIRTDMGNTISQENAGYMNRFLWNMGAHDIGMVNSTVSALSKLSVRGKALGQMCRKMADFEGEDSIFRFSNTPNVARDMLSIVHAWDEWRSSGTRDGLSIQGDAHSSNEDNDDPMSTKGKLVYWGFSYGTLLGATFASMFPDKVGRIMLDGVVDADHYVEPVWMDSLRDTDEIYESFFTYCFRAGVSCALFRRGDAGPSDIKTRLDNLLTELAEEPYIILPRGDDGGAPLLLSSGDIKQWLFTSLYAPNELFPLAAQLIDLIVQREGSLLARSGTGLPSLCGKFELPFVLDDAQKTVMCSDKRYKLNETVPELQERFERMSEVSSFADVWMGVMMGCNHWSIDAKDPPMRWDDRPAHKPKPIVTSFPLLFLTNRLDPVTPRHAALKMTRKFTNSSVVEQWASGHCTIACISSCTVAHIRAYLVDGIVPPPPRFKTPDSGDWAKCICEIEPWGKPLAAWGDDSSEVRQLKMVLKLEDAGTSRKFAAAYHDLHREVLQHVPGAREHNPLKQYLTRL